VSNTFMRVMPLRMRSPGLKLLVLFVAACGQYCRTVPEETCKGPKCTVCERWSQEYPTSLGPAKK